MEKRYLIKFEDLITELPPEDLKEDVFDVTFGSSMMVQFENHDGMLIAVNAMDGYGNNIAKQISGKRAELYQKVEYL